MTRAGSTQSKLTLRTPLAAPSRSATCKAIARARCGSGPHHAVFHRPTHGRAELQRIDPRDHLREARRQRLFKPRAHLLALLEPFCHDDRLGEEVVRQGDVERQVEADGALADIGGEPLDVRVGGEHLVECLDHVARRQDRGIVLQLQIHQQLGAVGGREELLRHQTGPGERSGEQTNRDRDRDPPGPHRRHQAAPEQAHRRTQSLAMRVLGRAQQRQADHRGKHDRRPPRRPAAPGPPRRTTRTCTRRRRCGRSRRAGTRRW